MKILHVIENLGSGGAEKLLEETLPLMKEKYNVDIEVLLLSDAKNVFGQKLVDSNIKISVIPIKNPKDIRNIFYIFKHIKNHEYDIVHSHLFPSIYWSSLAIKLIHKNKPKTVLTQHTAGNPRRKSSVNKIIDKFIYKSYDTCISVGRATQNNLIKWLNPADTELYKYTVIDNGINVKKFSQAKAYEKYKIKESFNDDTKLLCMVASFVEEKDQATIIKALKHVPNNVHLLLVGEGPLKNNLENLINKYLVKNRVHFLGFRNDVERIIKTSDIIIQSSKEEGFGLAAVEGMAAVKPLIGSDVSGMRKVIKGAAILFEVGNEKQLANIINKLINDKKYYDETSKACFKRANMYSLEKMVNKTVRLYQKLISPGYKS